MQKHSRITSLLALCAVLVLSACATTSVDEQSSESAAKSKTLDAVSKAVNLTDGLTATDIELGLLSGLLGSWDVQDWQLRKDGQWQALNGARWNFTAVQNGRALQDEWQSAGKEGHGVSGYVNALRVYDPISKNWQAAWLSSNDGAIKIFSGSQTQDEVMFTVNEESKGRLTRQVFSDIQTQSFAWRIEWSKDGGQNWLTVYRALATR